MECIKALQESEHQAYPGLSRFAHVGICGYSAMKTEDDLLQNFWNEGHINYIPCIYP